MAESEGASPVDRIKINNHDRLFSDRPSQNATATSIISSKQKWKEFLTRYYKPEIQQIALSDAKSKSLLVKYGDILKFSVRLADALLDNPDGVLKDAEDALPLVDVPINRRVRGNIRVVGLPRRILVRDLRGEHVNGLVSLDVNVRNATPVIDRIELAAFECARCGNITYIPEEGSGKFIEPAYCSCNEEKKGVFRLLSSKNESVFADFQRVRCQESFEEIRGGEQPKSIDINLIGEIAGRVWPGMHLVVNGIVREVQRLENNQKTVYFDRYIDANSLEYDITDYAELQITPEDEEAIKNIKKKGDVLGQFRRSIAPAIYGYDDIKEAIAFQLFSGPEINLEDGTHMRGDIHILLVGDPAIAKSQILRYVTQLSPRGQYANAKTSSGVGLTASVVKSDFGGEHWEVQAGPMVMADKGLLSLDEIEKMKPEHRADLLEAMEQQEINMAKAGKTVRMLCRACILAAANPVEGRFDPYEDMAGQINMEPYFISRFDLVYLMRDIPDEVKDRKIADHILRARSVGELLERKRHVRSNYKHADKELDGPLGSLDPEIKISLLRKYVAYAKRRIYPVMTQEARDHIASFYVFARTPSETNGPIMITPRQLEGVARLAEAAARMELSEVVTPQHAKLAIKIMGECFKVIARDPITGKTDIDVFLSGVSKSQRDRFKDLKKIIFELAVEYNKLIPRDKIIEQAKQNGLEPLTVEKSLKKLKEIGEIYEPKEGYISPS